MDNKTQPIIVPIEVEIEKLEKTKKLLEEIKQLAQEVKELIKSAPELTESQLKQINKYLGKDY